MNYKTFNLIDKINAEGLDNTKWNINMHLEKTDTKEFYGTRESFILPPGDWISVVEEKYSDFSFRSLCTPDHVVDIDARYVILFYEVDQPKNVLRHFPGHTMLNHLNGRIMQDR